MASVFYTTAAEGKKEDFFYKHLNETYEMMIGTRAFYDTPAEAKAHDLADGFASTNSVFKITVEKVETTE